MGGSSFEQLVQEVLKQKQLMDQLEGENRALRRQLAELRAGRGVFIDICGKRYALVADARQESGPQRAVPVAAAPAPAAVVEVSVVTGKLAEITEAPTTAMPQLAEAPTATMVESAEQQIAETPSTPLPEIELFEEEERKTPAMTFLEEAMIDEFATASTSPMAVWQAPAKKPEEIDEEEKAALRRQLIGSFLLE